jgi:hypothetical protein
VIEPMTPTKSKSSWVRLALSQAAAAVDLIAAELKEGKTVTLPIEQVHLLGAVLLNKTMGFPPSVLCWMREVADTLDSYSGWRGRDIALSRRPDGLYEARLVKAGAAKEDWDWEGTEAG